MFGGRSVRDERHSIGSPKYCLIDTNIVPTIKIRTVHCECNLFGEMRRWLLVGSALVGSVKLGRHTVCASYRRFLEISGDPLRSFEIPWDSFKISGEIVNLAKFLISRNAWKTIRRMLRQGSARGPLESSPILKLKREICLRWLNRISRGALLSNSSIQLRLIRTLKYPKESWINSVRDFERQDSFFCSSLKNKFENISRISVLDEWWFSPANSISLFSKHFGVSQSNSKHFRAFETLESRASLKVFQSIPNISKHFIVSQNRPNTASRSIILNLILERHTSFRNDLV